MRKSLSLVLSAAAALCFTAVAANVAGSQATKRLISPDRPIAAKASQAPNMVKAPKVAAVGHKTVAPSSSFKMRNENARKQAPKANFAPSALAEEIADLKGFVIYADDWTSDNAPAGLYQIEEEPQLIAEMIGGNGYYDDGEGTIYTVNMQSIFGIFFIITQSTYDSTTYEMLSTDPNGELSMVAFDMAVNPVDQLPYGCFYTNEGAFVWAVADYANWTTTPIATLSTQLLGVAFDRQGQAYGIDVNGILYRIEASTGVLTEVGNTGLQPQYLSSAAIDMLSNKLYFSYSPADETGWLYEINMQTAEATPVYQFANSEEITNLFFPLILADDKAPAAPELAVVTDKGDMTAKWTVTAPTTLFDGTAASGDVTYTLNVDGNTVSEGTVAYGATVEGEYTATTPGNHAFAVSLTGADGLTGPSTRQNVYFGFGVPSAPASAVASFSDDKMIIAWDAVETSTDAGYFDPTAVTYTVFDAQENVVGEDLTATSLEIAMAAPTELTRFEYTVVAKANGRTSAGTVTNSVILGVAVPPYVIDFDNPGALDFLTLIDNNNDGYAWTLTGNDANHYLSCRYNMSDNMDDYMISSPVQLKGGEVYRISVDAWAGSAWYLETVELLAGYSNTVEAMTKVLVEPVTLEGTAVHNLAAYYMPEQDEVLYIGVHGMSDADQLSLNIDNVIVAAPQSAKAPQAVEDIALVADPQGELSVEITAVAPSVNFAGNAVDPLTKIEVLRDGELLATLTDVTAGDAFTYVDNTVPVNGTYTYTFVAYNEFGAGAEVSASVYVGFDTPSVVTDLTIVETATPGEVTVSWKAPATDILGNAVPADKFKYNVYTVDGTGALQLFLEAITETTFTEMVVPEGQDFVYFVVKSVLYDTVESANAFTDMIPVGSPYLAPFHFTFDDASFEAYIMGTDSSGRSSWGVYSEGYFSDLTGYDDEDFAGCQGTAIGSYADLFTGKISLAELTAPTLTFYTYKIAEDDPNVMEVLVTCDGITDTIADLSNLDAPVEVGWYENSLSLTEYAGKTIQITFRAICNYYTYSFLDNICIEQGLDHDLAAGKLTAPLSVEPNTEFEVVATVTNKGAETAENFTVNFYLNGEEVASYPIEALGAGETENYALDQTLTIMSDELNEYSVQIEYAADENQDNNTATPVTVTLVESTLAGIEDLHGENVEGGFKLSWTAPDPSTFTPDAVVEGFENMDEYGDMNPWISVDVDGLPVGGIQGVTWDYLQQAAGFLILDTENGQFADVSLMQPHSGTHLAVSCFLYDGSNCDDWLISPELYGGPQTISFYANSYVAQYLEQIEVLVSTTGTEIEDFVAVTEPIIVPGTNTSDATAAVNYTKYTASLPDGAKYFAIRSYGTNAFFLMLDDIEYIPVGATSTLEVVGYNVYCNGKKLNEQPITETEYLDTEVQAANAYCVTVVFNRGESRRSNIVYATETGIDAITNAAAKVAVEGNAIVVTGAKNMEVAIFTADGKAIARNEGDTRVNVAPAVYVVKVGNKTTKVVVR